MSVAPRRRDYKEDDPKRKRDVASDDRLRLWLPLFLGCGIGLIWGGVLGGSRFGNAVAGALIGLVLMGGFTMLVTKLFIGGASNSVAKTLLPSGKSTAYKRQYSDAEAASARGDYQQAILAYQRYQMEDPSDHQPYLHIARIYRNELQDFASAAVWYKRARNESVLDGGKEMFVTEQLAELYLHKLKDPRKAIPELARLAERFPQTPTGQAALRELAVLREMLAQEHENWESLTARYYRDKRTDE
jgi:hypothetical protein